MGTPPKNERRIIGTPSLHMLAGAATIFRNAFFERKRLRAIIGCNRTMNNLASQKRIIKHSMIPSPFRHRILLGPLVDALTANIHVHINS
ncbi:MAG: hypothetical protein WC477_07750 [Patescibacteria group bacterium]